jgi:hypothetical protein
MKTVVLILATLVICIDFSTASVMAQQTGIGGKLNLTSTAELKGQIRTARDSRAQQANFKVNNTRIKGDAKSFLKSKVSGDIIVNKGGTLEHSSANLSHSQISGNLNANLQAESNTMKVDNNAHLYVSSLDMHHSMINGNLSINSRSETGAITLQKNAYANIASLRMNNSTLHGGTAILNTNTGNIRIDKGGKAYISSIDMQGARITGPVNLNSHTAISDVHIKKGGKLNVASLVLDGGSHGGINEKVHVAVSSNITVGRNTEVEIGAVEMSD